MTIADAFVWSLNGGFWRFLGALLIIGAVAHGLARIILAVRGIDKRSVDEED